MDSKRSVALFDNLIRSSKKRRRKEDEEIDDLLLEIDNEVDQDDDDDDEFIFATLIPEAVSILNNGEKIRGPCKPNVERATEKESWTNGYRIWDDTQFKSRVRISRDTFRYILDIIGPYIEKIPTNFVPNPIETHRLTCMWCRKSLHSRLITRLNEFTVD